MTNAKGSMSDFSASAPLTRQITSRAVLRAVIDGAPISRAELARVTGLSKQAMSEIVRDLEIGGWLRVGGKTSGGAGRSAVTYEISPRKAVLYGVDVGGTKIHAALADLTGTVVADEKAATDPRGGEHVVEQIGALLDRLLAQTDTPARAVAAAAIGVPGAVDPGTRRLRLVPNIPGLTDIDFDDALRRRLGCPVRLENDVNLAAKGEQWLGRSRDVDDFVFIALGTGIGMGIISDGRLLRGRHGAAGEIAGLPIGGDPFDSANFASGVLETAVGSHAFRRRYEGLGGDAGLSVRELFERTGDPAAATVVDEVARLIAVAVAAVTAVVDPAMVVFGGSVGARVELVDRVRFHLARCLPSPPACVISDLGSRASLLGAIGVARESFHESLFELPGLAADPIAPLSSNE
jgi:predicted NBD/HSP70 family sugar kinase